ncbi:glycerophosphodiester phosphodiesterase [Cesiribacter andamanensis]|uniref:Glycerophosphoryl diester phosphodiesterase n=1 Tax=Cesiribacter andamanensis AMV16 TaxID=1279009 RepID=M7NRR5_9BACT|nr:glycerophosphodiester phosphodiesterase family protein [Cesiribacter andamanensis]EMR04385.1 Glycerophosphoryl diester phosphodiesterase [Cesiribacter andamanensis AMV16]
MSLAAQLIIAHRGASYLAPENTLAAVRLGYELGADAVEIDVHLSRDGRLVVHHDADTRRTAGGKKLLIRETDYANLQQLEVGSWKAEQYRGEKIPLLEEVLAEVPEGRQLVIELKTGPEILPYLVETLQHSGIQDRLVLISFSREAIAGARELLPAIPAYWLLHNYRQHRLAEAVAFAQEKGLKGLDVHYKLATKAFMQRMQEAGLEVWVYTVDDPGKAARLRKRGCVLLPPTGQRGCGKKWTEAHWRLLVPYSTAEAVTSVT